MKQKHTGHSCIHHDTSPQNIPHPLDMGYLSTERGIYVATYRQKYYYQIQKIILYIFTDNASINEKWCERVYLPLCKVADTPFYFQGDGMFCADVSWGMQERPICFLKF